MKISVLFTILFFFFITSIETAIPFAEAKNKKQISSSESPVSYRSISSGDINQQLNNSFTSLKKKVCGNSKEKEKLLGFINHLNQLKQYIVNLKRDFQLTLKDRELLNAIFGQIQELPYEEIMKENKAVSEKAFIIRSMFEHNYRYAYPEEVSFAWWAQSIVESLSCLSERNSKVLKKPANQREPGKQD